MEAFPGEELKDDDRTVEDLLVETDNKMYAMKKSMRTASYEKQIL